MKIDWKSYLTDSDKKLEDAVPRLSNPLSMIASTTEDGVNP
jgi:hypothetical protein